MKPLITLLVSVFIFGGCATKEQYTAPIQQVSKIQMISNAQMQLASKGYGSSRMGNNILGLKIKDEYQNVIHIHLRVRTNKFDPSKPPFFKMDVAKYNPRKKNTLQLNEQDIEAANQVLKIASL